jgi:uncharacterized delta-60 repeat protein
MFYIRILPDLLTVGITTYDTKTSNTMKKLFFTFFYSLSALACMAQASFFDPTFGTGGKVIVPLGATINGIFKAIVLQPDGKMVVAGIMEGRPVVARFKENGTLDSSFAVNGIYISPAWNNGFQDLLLQPDGKIVAVGGFTMTLGNHDFWAVRLTAAGVPDVTFGSSGIAIIDFTGSNDDAYSVALQADGKIVIAGSAVSDRIGLARLLVDGSIDSSFGTNGLVVSGYDRAYFVDIAPDGKIVIGGHSSPAHHFEMIAMRFLADGTVDTSFNHIGIVYTQAGNPGGNNGAALKVLPDGKVLLAGSGDFGIEGSNFVVVKYNTDGSLDGAFGSGGIADVDFGYGPDAVGGMYIENDGKILIVGSTISVIDKANVAVARFDGSGILDDGFANHGKIVAQLRAYNDYGAAITQQIDGKIVVVGASYKGTGSATYCDPTVVRFLPAPSGVGGVCGMNGADVLYPNPAQGRLFVNAPGGADIAGVMVTDVLGRWVRAEVVDGAIEIATWADGLYFFRVAFGDGMTVVERVWVRN